MEFMEMCCKNGFFTCGDNKQYKKVIDYYNLARSCFYTYTTMLEAIVYMTYICSDMDKFSVDDVRKAVYELFADKEIFV